MRVAAFTPGDGEEGWKMRKTLWIIPVLLLIAAIGAPCASADAVGITLTGVIAGPPEQFQVTIQDATDGLATIVVTAADNATVSVSAFSAATTSPILVFGTKIDQSLPFDFALTATDVKGFTTSATFTDAPSSAPEPTTLSLMLLGMVFVLVMRKRIAKGLPQAA
jgi:hypothetical protein